MQPLIAGKYIDKYLIYSRFSTICTVITEQRFLQMVHLSENPDSLTPKWLKQIFNKFGYSEIIPYKFNDAIFVRRPSSTNFGRASFEITKSCNYKCHHCYLGKKTTRSLSTSEKQKILQIIDKSGCLWLQITGGEPLLSEDFIAVYTYAYSLGLLITLSTNGSLLINSNIKDTISKYPPFRITISMYGATQDSYENLTQVKGSFSQFTNSLEWVKKMGIKVRINIIITRFNEHELDAMINMVNKYNFECCIYSKLTPTIDGDPHRLNLWELTIGKLKMKTYSQRRRLKKVRVKRE